MHNLLLSNREIKPYDPVITYKNAWASRVSEYENIQSCNEFNDLNNNVY